MTSTATSSTTTTPHSAVSLEGPLPLAAAAGALMALFPPALVLGLGAPRRIPWDVFLASLDVASDLFWVLTGSFYNEGTLGAAAACLAAASLVFVPAFFGRACARRPAQWAETAAGAFCKVSGMAWGRVGRPLLEQHCFLVYEDLDGELTNLLVNVAAFLLRAAATALLLALLPVPAALLALALLAAAALWLPSMLLLGMALHATRLLVVKRVLEAYWRLLGDSDEADGAAHEKVAGLSAQELGAFSLRLWNYVVVSELLFESVPSLLINVLDAALLQKEGLASFDIPSALALGSSVFVMLQLGFRVLYFTAYKGKPLAEVPPRLPSTRVAAADAATSVGGNILS